MLTASSKLPSQEKLKFTQSLIHWLLGKVFTLLLTSMKTYPIGSVCNAKGLSRKNWEGNGIVKPSPGFASTEHHFLGLSMN